MSCSSPEELRQKPESSPFNIKEEFSVTEDEVEPSIVEHELQPITDELKQRFRERCHKPIVSIHIQSTSFPDLGGWYDWDSVDAPTQPEKEEEEDPLAQHIEGCFTPDGEPLELRYLLMLEKDVYLRFPLLSSSWHKFHIEPSSNEITKIHIKGRDVYVRINKTEVFIFLMPNEYYLCETELPETGILALKAFEESLREVDVVIRSRPHPNFPNRERWWFPLGGYSFEPQIQYHTRSSKKEAYVDVKLLEHFYGGEKCYPPQRADSIFDVKLTREHSRSTLP